jgi:CelD/BcsL family acetyltransferase involved in cellulose biosynthesis/predicted ATP-grasp superfamily ATP-dependent carboligase
LPISVKIVTQATTLKAYRNADVAADIGRTDHAHQPSIACEVASDLKLSIHTSLCEIEILWRRFEQVADCTAFQTFDWLATWNRYVGAREGVVPAIVVGTFAHGETAFILPLAVEARRAARRLCWLGQELADYNAPLIARDFSRRVTSDRFVDAWHELRERMQRDPLLRHDWIELEKMPKTIGSQINPFTYLGVTPNASGAYITQLGSDWKKFYNDKRSSATRRRDRAKRRHMSEFGEVRFVTAADEDDARRIIEVLMEQKRRSFARKGIPDMFARPGCREFFLDLASNPKTRHLVHVSRVEIGTECVAANLGIIFGDCYYHILASFGGGEAAHFGPGALHLRELLAYAIGKGLRRFDFTIGDEPYKLEWSDVHVTLWDHSTAATWRGWPVNGLSIPRRRIKRFIKQTPAVWRLVSRVRAAVGSLLLPEEPEPQLRRPVASVAAANHSALACVMGDMDLLRPVVLAALPCAVVTRPGVPSLYSRRTQARLPWPDFAGNAEGLVDALVRLGETQSERPVLFYEEDAQLLAVSRHRERLAQTFRFVIADAPLVEDLLDKARFQTLAERHGLPVPAARQFHPIAVEPDDLDLRFPVIIKPLTRLARWDEHFGLCKALEAPNADALRALWPQLLDVGIDLLAQELIPGAESQIESYHCYVDQNGSIAGEFTGRKIRTYPVSYGHTTALETTHAADVRGQGRALVERIGLTGVAKLDFKRDPQGKLHLLEINPRFSLWHHVGAVAGVNIPALVYADLTGTPRPAVARAKAGIRWCRLWKDFPAARASGVPLATWLPWALRCEAKSALSWDDPTPVMRAMLHRLSARRQNEIAS